MLVVTLRFIILVGNIMTTLQLARGKRKGRWRWRWNLPLKWDNRKYGTQDKSECHYSECISPIIVYEAFNKSTTSKLYYAHHNYNVYIYSRLKNPFCLRKKTINNDNLHDTEELVPVGDISANPEGNTGTRPRKQQSVTHYCTHHNTYLVLEREERERVLVHNNNRIIDDEATEGVRSLSRPDAAPPQQRMWNRPIFQGRLYPSTEISIIISWKASTLAAAAATGSWINKKNEPQQELRQWKLWRWRQADTETDPQQRRRKP